LLAVAVAGSVLFYYHSRRAPSLTEKDTILLADFVNTTGEAVFDGTLKEALAVQLGQSPFLNLFPEQSVRETLGYMGRSTDERITRDIGREICERQGIKALLLGSISSLGSHYVITLEALNGPHGRCVRARAGGSRKQGTGARRSGPGSLSPARTPRRIPRLDSEVQRARPAGHHCLLRSFARLLARRRAKG
jgi:hypothetical protein